MKNFLVRNFQQNPASTRRRQNWSCCELGQWRGSLNLLCGRITIPPPTSPKGTFRCRGLTSNLMFVVEHSLLPLPGKEAEREAKKTERFSVNDRSWIHFLQKQKVFKEMINKSIYSMALLSPFTASNPHPWFPAKKMTVILSSRLGSQKSMTKKIS